MRQITVAVVQMKPIAGSLEDNLVKMTEWVTTIAARQRVDLIVFPELVTTGTDLGIGFTDVAQRVPGMVLNVLSQRANDFGVYIAFGMATKERVESVLYNSAVLIGPSGDLVDVYHKLHLRGEERMVFREGFKLPTTETLEIGTLGMMLGYDLAFPEVARSQAMDGAEILLVMANWEAREQDAWRTYLRSRALENGLFVIGANRVGQDGANAFGGESMIVGPHGEIYASMADKTDPVTGEPQDGYIMATFDLEDVRRTREESQVIQNRQPTVYKSIVRKY
jgi:predicted amidohydrolase